MNRVTSAELNEHLQNARFQVRMLGTLPFSPEWEKLLPAWRQAKDSSTGFTVSILCESDNLLFARSFLTDSPRATQRHTFTELAFLRDTVVQELRTSRTAGGGAAPQSNDWLTVKKMHLPIPMSVVTVDDAVYFSLSLEDPFGPIEQLPRDHPWRELLQEYVDAYFDQQRGAKYADEWGAEILELFDHGRVPRGIYPRKSFYDTDYHQFVVWALIFDRSGRLLIHRRSDNAKDNRGMWDKSVGGHVDFAEDTDASRAVWRELVEELFADELREAEGGFRPLTVTGTDIVYLGDWRPETRGRAPFREINEFTKEWAFFRVPESQTVATPRRLPDGTDKRLRVVADVFLFVAGPILSETNLQHFKNSLYKLVDPLELKTIMDHGSRGEVVAGFDPSKPVPEFTPDLTTIMTGGLRSTVDQFSQYIKRYIARG